MCSCAGNSFIQQRYTHFGHPVASGKVKVSKRVTDNQKAATGSSFTENRYRNENPPDPGNKKRPGTVAEDLFIFFYVFMVIAVPISMIVFLFINAWISLFILLGCWAVVGLIFLIQWIVECLKNRKPR